MRKGERNVAAAGARARKATAACLLAVAMACGVLAPDARQGGAFETQGPVSDTLLVNDRESEFPCIDWGRLLAVNPDVVGWVTVPGTAIDQPIVQASPGNDAFYLSHGLDRSPEPMGCAFLDADCPAGLESPNCVVYGHNWNGRRMFADFAGFPDQAFAEEHATVLLQTPRSKRRLEVRCVEVAGGADDTNVTSFEGTEELASWFQARYASSCVRLAPPPVGEAAPGRVYTFCTCADGPGDERVLVYAAET